MISWTSLRKVDKCFFSADSGSRNEIKRNGLLKSAARPHVHQDCNAVEWNGMESMECNAVEWNGCILDNFGHFGSFCTLLVIVGHLFDPKIQNRKVWVLSAQRIRLV